MPSERFQGILDLLDLYVEHSDFYSGINRIRKNANAKICYLVDHHSWMDS